jgi:hypothetical protein
MRAFTVISGFLLVSVSACTSAPEPVPPSAATTTSTQAVAAPPTPVPAADGKCPYLDSAFVADANGERVGKVKLSVGGGTPACFFYRPDGGVQVTVWVYAGGAATAVVDRAAPRETSNPASSPAGWRGGSQPTSTGAVYAVAKANSAVVVTTNQSQTIKARRIAEKAIAALGL